MKKILWTICTVIFVSTIALPTLLLAEKPSPYFNPGMIIPDSAFIDTKTFGSAAAIQDFLESKHSILADTSLDFLKRLKEPTDSAVKQTLDDPHYNLKRLRTAAELIWDASQSTGLNPQVIIVTLNKEQGLITDKHTDSDLQRALDHSMGFACPDSGKCNGTLSGFYFQLFGNVDSAGERYLGAAKSLMKSFQTPGGRGPTIDGQVTHIGDKIILDNTLGGYEGIEAKQLVQIENRSTAALYRYTPHVYNGNYNFWRFFTAWFKYGDGTLLKDVATDTYYLLQKGKRNQIPEFVARIRKLNLAKAVHASPTEIANYPLGEFLGPRDNTIVSVNGTTYIFKKNIKYPAPALVIKQKGLSPSTAVRISAADSMLFINGAMMMPTEGTIIRSAGSTKTYMVQKGVLKLFTRFTANQYEANAHVNIVPAKEFAQYPNQGFVAPKDGTLVKGKTGSTIYLMRDGEKHPVEKALLLNLGYKVSEAVKLSDAEVINFTLGKAITPKEGTYFKIAGSPIVYVFQKGAVHMVSDAIVKQKGIKSRYTFGSDTVKDWPKGDDIK